MLGKEKSLPISSLFKIYPRFLILFLFHCPYLSHHFASVLLVVTRGICQLVSVYLPCVHRGLVILICLNNLMSKNKSFCYSAGGIADRRYFFLWWIFDILVLCLSRSCNLDLFEQFDVKMNKILLPQPAVLPIFGIFSCSEDLTSFDIFKIACTIACVDLTKWLNSITL